MQFNVDPSSNMTWSTGAGISSTASKPTKLETLYSGLVESTHGSLFTLQNTAKEESAILTGFGLNVQTSPTTLSGAGMIAGQEGPCRVKLYARSSASDAYELALDTSDVTCMGPEVETLVTDEMILSYYKENFGGEEYPLVIGAGESLEVYIVVLGVDGEESGMVPILLSSEG